MINIRFCLWFDVVLVFSLPFSNNFPRLSHFHFFLICFALISFDLLFHLIFLPLIYTLSWILGSLILLFCLLVFYRCPLVLHRFIPCHCLGCHRFLPIVFFCLSLLIFTFLLAFFLFSYPSLISLFLFFALLKTQFLSYHSHVYYRFLLFLPIAYLFFFSFILC